MESLWNVSAESLVKWTGVSDDGTESLPEASPNMTKLKSQLGIVQARPLPAQMQIYSEVAAKYLPGLVDVFKRTPEVVSPVSTLINTISTTPYFIRFLRSPAGAGLAALQANRVANNVDEIPTMSVDDVGETGQFLSSLLLLQGTQDVSAEDKAILVQHLPDWERKYRGRLASDTAGRCLALLNNDPSMRQMIDGVRNMLESKLDKCGGPGCVRRVQKDGSVLSQCGRCKSAVYCGVAHQKAAWAAHKATCFAAAF
ncbi:hypothetical protein B0H11DRAFT_2074643 [Mycena galericulata]|nr:hypothetical protein B0H11DRAFT_2074643 [Mycena galericulata]